MGKHKKNVFKCMRTNKPNLLGYKYILKRFWTALHEPRCWRCLHFSSPSTFYGFSFLLSPFVSATELTFFVHFKCVWLYLIYHILIQKDFAFEILMFWVLLIIILWFLLFFRYCKRYISVFSSFLVLNKTVNVGLDSNSKS